MSALDPANTTANDLVTQALKECHAIGVGQTPTAEDLSDGLVRLMWMLQQWARKRWFVYQLKTYSVTSNGGRSYSVGPGGQIDTGANTVRPARLESGNFLRQLVTSQPNQIDYPIEVLQSMEDYNRISLKGLVSFSYWAFYDPGWPLGALYFWPIPNADIYSLHINVLQQLPSKIAANTVFNLPYEYYAAMLYNLAIRLKPKYGMRVLPGDPLITLAKDASNVLVGANTAIARLMMPPQLIRSGIYNIFSDQYY